MKTDNSITENLLAAQSHGILSRVCLALMRGRVGVIWIFVISLLLSSGKASLDLGLSGFAAEPTTAEAQCNLGFAYYRGNGAPRDLTKAMQWFRKAAEQGSAIAQYNLGFMYDAGEGVAANGAEAVKWYGMAANQGNVDAQFNLGLMYCKGDEVPKDGIAAVKWFRLAAAQGEAKAANSLGFMYNTGDGVPVDGVVAAKWYRLEKATKDVGALRAYRPPSIDAETKQRLDAAPIYLWYLDSSLAGPPYGQVPAKGTIYILTFMRMIQKVPNGYMMRADPPAGGAVSTEPAFLKTEMDLPENAIFLDTAHFAFCNGTYEYEAVNGFARKIWEFSPLTDEANRYVMERLRKRQDEQDVAAGNKLTPTAELAAARAAVGFDPK